MDNGKRRELTNEDDRNARIAIHVQSWRELHADERTSTTTIPSDGYSGIQNIPREDAEFVTLAENCAGSKEKTVIVYSADSTCDIASRAAAQLEAAGFTDVHAYSGGAKAWHANGGVLA